MSENNRIIVVDDEKDIVQAYIDFLQPAADTAPKKSSRRSSSATSDDRSPSAAAHQDQYEILKAYNGTDAVDLVKKEFEKGNRIAGGFFDVKMEGGLDGLQTIQAIWKIDPGVHCTIVTAYQDRSVQDINQLFSQIFGNQVKDQWDY